LVGICEEFLNVACNAVWRRLYLRAYSVQGWILILLALKGICPARLLVTTVYIQICNRVVTSCLSAKCRTVSSVSILHRMARDGRRNAVKEMTPKNKIIRPRPQGVDIRAEEDFFKRNSHIIRA
jgi:hypothetical protein